MPDMPKEEASPLFSNIWAGRQLGIDLLTEGVGAINPAVIKYLCNYRYPYLQIINPESVESEGFSLNIINATSGGMIIDYGIAVSVSLQNNVTSSKKTSTEIQVATVSEIANLIATKEWNVVELISGSDLMKRLLWTESQRYSFTLRGYEPTEEDSVFLNRLKSLIEAGGSSWEKRRAVDPNKVVAVAASG